MEASTNPPGSSASPWRYRGTLFLFAIVAAAIVVWFQRHIEPYVTETLIIGGTISLWGLWKLVWSIFEDAGGEGGKDLTRRFLGNRAALRALWFAAIIVAMLHFCTASIYLRIAGARSGEDSFKVQILEGEKVFMGPFELHPGETLGRPIFPSFRTHELEYQILDRRGFQPLKQTLAPWGTHDVKVPGDFARRTLHIVALVPDKVLYSDLPNQTETGGERYYLKVTAQGETAILNDYSKQLVVTGARLDDLPDQSTVSHDANIRQELGDHYAHAGVDQPETVVSTLLDAGVARLGSAELGADGAIEVEVGTWEEVDGKPQSKKKFECSFQAPADGALHTRVIGTLETGDCK